MAIKKGGLGRGLDSLFSENASDSQSAVNIRLTDIEPNREQPRKDFDEEALSELAESISKHGLIQPIVVRPQANGSYRIIAGERRWRACRMAGLKEVPVVVKEIDDKELMELALIENLQREASRCRFSISANSISSLSSISFTTTGTSLSPAIRQALQRRSPAIMR